MADFTHTFTLTAIADDGRTITMSNSDILSEVEQVYKGLVPNGSFGTIYGPTNGGSPAFASEPILMIFHALAEGIEVNIENTAADTGLFDLPRNGAFVMHGTETFEVGTVGATATNAETLEQVNYSNSNGSVAYFILTGPTS